MPRTLVKGDDLGQAIEQARRVATLKSGGVLGMERRYDTDVLESSGQGASQFIEALRWLDQESSGSTLAGFTDLTSAAAEGRGSFALSKDQTDFFLNSRNAVLREMAACIQSYLVADLVAYNFGPSGAVPTVELGPVGNADMDQVQALLATLAPAQTLRAPDALVSELVTKIAGHFDLDEDKIRSAIVEKEQQLQEQAKTEQEARVATMKAGVDVAAAQVARATQPPAAQAQNPAQARPAAKKATTAKRAPRSRPRKTQTETVRGRRG
jgi:pyruvate/2-oxoglutarate dehydrogenase complex dihydrolipoamide acyltransferase (E2) component